MNPYICTHNTHSSEETDVYAHGQSNLQKAQVDAVMSGNVTKVSINSVLEASCSYLLLVMCYVSKYML